MTSGLPHSDEAPEKTSLRAENAAQTREHLLATAIALVERGDEPTMRAVAAEARVGERTIYRYFESREVLLTALAPRVAARTTIPLVDTFEALPGYAAALFGLFEDNRGLNVALLTSAWAMPLFRGSRRKNLNDLRRLVDRAFPDAPFDQRAAAASVLRTQISGISWMYLRISCGLSAPEVVTHVRWLIETCAARLRAEGRRR